jgi:CPA2 family monovalent cation:H+ antiporter-2
LLVALAVALTLVGKLGTGVVAGRIGGFSQRQGLNAGAALVAHGEFTIILAQVASGNASLDVAQRTDLVAFAGLYVLVTATIGLALMKESKRLGRALFTTSSIPRLTEEA